MNKFAFALAALSLPVTANADDHAARGGDPHPSLEVMATATLNHDTIAWDFVEGLTTEVGPRQAGTEAEARARAWAMAWLTKNGFQNVASEPFERLKFSARVRSRLWSSRLAALHQPDQRGSRPRSSISGRWTICARRQMAA